jgi:pimeloyl-ACP methyl ester carboxylesterase
MACSISLTGADQQTLQIPAGNTASAQFIFNAPSKIKNLQSVSLDVRSDCTGFYTEHCGMFYLDTCNRQTISRQFQESITVNFQLTPQDQQNQAFLQQYTSALSNQMTSTDVIIKTFSELVDKTPAPLLPVSTYDSHNQMKSSFTKANNRYTAAIQALEDENYDLALAMPSHTDDLDSLQQISQQSETLSQQINENIASYNQLVTDMNQYNERIKQEVSEINTPANAQIIQGINTAIASTTKRIESYDFDSINDAKNIIADHKKSISAKIADAKARQNAAIQDKLALLRAQINRLCSENQLCDPNSQIQGKDTVSKEDFCDLSKQTISISENYNQKLIDDYKNAAEKLSEQSELSGEQIIRLVNEAKEELNENISVIQKAIQDDVNAINKAGTEVDLIEYNSLTTEYRDASLIQRRDLLEKFELQQQRIHKQKLEVVDNTNGFVLFFKKLFKGLFVKKQDVIMPAMETIVPPASSDQSILDAYNENCVDSGNNIISTGATQLAVRLSTHESTIKTVALEAQTSCVNENGQRTTNCCSGDEYSDKEELYPVIFVHGHASETGGRVVQDSLDTFKTMATQFARNGYVQKDLLYPEDSMSLAKGAWSYCKPVVVRVTYYEGISTGQDATYSDKGIATYSPTLSKEVDAVLRATNKDKVIIVAHSMGGIVSRYYIKYDGGQTKVDKIITISSPHYGTRTLYSVLGPISYILLGATESAQMKQGSSFLQALNSPSDSLVDSYTIMGDNDGCITAPCDGVVAVDTAKLKGAKKNEVFNGTQYEHNAIVDQPEIATEVLNIIQS